MKNRIRELRLSQHLTQDDVVKSVGITRQGLSGIELNYYEPTIGNGLKIATVLGKCPHEVFDFDGTGRYDCKNYDCCTQK